MPLQFGARWIAAPVSFEKSDCSKSYLLSTPFPISIRIHSHLYRYFMALLTKGESGREASDSRACDEDFQGSIGIYQFLGSHFL
jgi:hypothetical protein